MFQTLSTLITERFDEEVQFLQQMVQCRSSNPLTPERSSPDVPVEAQVADLIQRHLQQRGFTPALHGLSRHRPNVVCSLSGCGPLPRKSLILTTHMDTVEPSDAYTRDPFGGQIEGERLYGVGAADAKAQIAAFIYAALAIRQAGIRLRGDLTLAFVVDEESGACSSFGTRYLLEQGLLIGDAALVGEPGDGKIATGHRGIYRFRLQTSGEAVHTGLKAWEEGTRGRNAIADMAHLIVTLTGCTLPSPASTAFPGRKAILTFPTIIEGGSAVNMVPDRCEAYGDARLLPGTSEADISQVLQQCLGSHTDIACQLETIAFVPAVEISPQAEIVQCLSSAIERTTGQHLRREGGGPACDGWMFISHGIPAVCGYGVACGGVHGADEWADLASLRQVTEVYARTILQYLGYE